MSTVVDCVCCREYDRITQKIKQDGVSDICITQHPGFAAVCLNLWVLQAAYIQYHQEHHVNLHIYLHRLMIVIDTLLTELVHWCSGWLGRDIRVALPSCAVNIIRNIFPSPDSVYTGVYTHYPKIITIIKIKFIIFEEIGFDEQKWHKVFGRQSYCLHKGQAEEGMVAQHSNHALLSSAIPEIISLYVTRG